MQSECTVSRSIRANDLGTRLPYIECLIYWSESSGSYISHKVKINEQNKSIATGPFHVRTEFEPIWTLLPEDVAFLNHMGHRTL